MVVVPEADMSSYWMTLRKKEDTQILMGSTRFHSLDNQNNITLSVQHNYILEKCYTFQIK
jgi:hypothetical protein